MGDNKVWSKGSGDDNLDELKAHAEKTIGIVFKAHGAHLGSFPASKKGELDENLIAFVPHYRGGDLAITEITGATPEMLMEILKESDIENEEFQAFDEDSSASIPRFITVDVTQENFQEKLKTLVENNRELLCTMYATMVSDCLCQIQETLPMEMDGKTPLDRALAADVLQSALGKLREFATTLGIVEVLKYKTFGILKDGEQGAARHN